AMATKQYWGALDVVGLIALSYVILGTTWITGAGLHILKKPAMVSAAFIAGALLNIVLNLSLIPHMGMMGAAWATFISFLFISAFTFIASQRRFPVRYEWRKLSAILLWAILIALVSLVSGRVWWRIVLSVLFALPGLWFYRKSLFGATGGFLVRKALKPSEHNEIPEDLTVEKITDPELIPPFRKGMERVYRERLERGILCYVGFWRGQPAHITWVATRGEREPRTGYRAKPGIAYVFDSLTLPEFRSHGIYAGVLEQVSRDARGNGMKFAEAVVLEDNEPSLRAFGNAGFVPVARVLGLKIFGITFCLRRSLESGEG
ncbi:MAG: polysaccharide biosynthesis C-terminal domain-containing protein, partial [candidate division WOR-3 bacterium]